MPAGLTGGPAILARLRAQRGAAAAAAGAPAKQQEEVVILYASQTGTGQEIARSIQADSAKHGIKTKVMSLNECGFEGISATKTPVVVMVASSTGDGDPPDNSAKTFQALRRRSNPPDLLQGVRYTVLGLGDSNYTKFMYVPRALKTRFAELGASQFYECAEADEVDGIEGVVDAWVQGLWPVLKAAMAKVEGGVKVVTAAEAVSDGVAALDLTGVPALAKCRVHVEYEQDNSRAETVLAAERAGPDGKQLGYRQAQGEYSVEQPFWAPVVEARYLTTDKSDRKVLHVGLSIADSGMRYLPGDSIGVLPANDEALVDALLQRLGLDGTAVFSVAAQGGEAGAQGARLLPHLGWPCSVKHAFMYGVDITSAPRKSLLRLLAEHCSAEEEQRLLLQLCSKEGRELYKQDMVEQQPSLLQLLSRFPSCTPPLAPLLDLLPALAPRMYSITTAPQQHPQQVQVAFSIVHMNTKYGEKKGVATNWLERVCRPLLKGVHQECGGGLHVPIFLRSGAAFRPPQDLDKPWIMIGPGTGVAPFRGFLQYRHHLPGMNRLHAPAWLFFGCRNRAHDYLYQQDLEAFLADGTLSQLQVAFSREQQGKVYVQHLMKKHGETLFKMLEEDAYVFVCGDGAAMAKDVHECLIGIIVEHGGVDKTEAAAQLAHMAKNQHYVRDVWS